KVLLVRQLRSTLQPPVSRRGPPSIPFPPESRQSYPDSAAMRAAVAYVAPKHVVAIASSTGGPSALLEIFAKVPPSSTAGIVGARAIRDAGGLVVAESQDTAVVYGIPGAAVRAGVTQMVLPLPQIAELIAQLS